MSTHSFAEPLTSRVILAGVPTASMPSGIVMPGGTVQPGRDQGAAADDGTVENGGAVPDQCLGADSRAVHDTQVADRRACSHLGDGIVPTVQHRAVLDVGTAPHDDRSEVGAQYRAVPDRGPVFDPDIADQRGGRGDPGSGADSRGVSLKRE